MQDNLLEIAQIFAEIDDGNLINSFLKQILTSNELKEVSQRWELVKLVHRGMPQREIARKLGISLCKITRGAKELKKPNNAFKKILEKRGKNK